MNTIVIKIDFIFDVFIVFLCIILFLVGLYSVIDNYLMYQSVFDDSLLRYKPDYEGLSDEEADQKIISSMVGWVSIDDTDIDFPIMQGIDNIEFLNKDPYGNYSLTGSIFLDSQNNSDFSDDYNIVYGHHMIGAMFGLLDAYYEEDYFKKHQYGILYIGEEKHFVEFFAVLSEMATNRTVFSVKTKIKDLLDFIKENHLWIDNTKLPDTSDKVIALSTCKYPDTIDRTIVLGKISD